MEHARIRFDRCPLCESTDSVVLRSDACSHHPSFKPGLPRTMRWLRCRACEHIYVDGYFGPEALDLLFSNSLPHQTPGAALEQARHIAAAMVEKVCAEQPRPGGRWLDIGFGNGALLTTAAEFGFEPIGLDLRTANVELMREAGCEAHATPFLEYRPELPLDVISMADVLEHMPFPKPTLVHARALLQPDGLLLVSMPNADAHLWRTLTRLGTNPYWSELEHLHNFGRRRLYALLRECGFEPIRYGVSARYRICMEVLARRSPDAAAAPA